jgi:hypothetical protein
VHFEHDVAVSAERRDPIALLSAGIAQQSREAMRPLAKFAISKATHAVNDGGALGKYFRRAVQEVSRV